jgi:hypothetical protein
MSPAQKAANITKMMQFKRPGVAHKAAKKAFRAAPR